MVRKLFFLIFISGILLSCNTIPKGPFIEPSENDSPDYSNLDHWAASPFKMDPSDRRPEGLPPDQSMHSEVDIFFLHPTSYTRKPGNKNWNGSVNNEKLNNKTDQGAILYQASVFNSTGRIFAPRYRQAHVYSFYNRKEKNKPYAEKALDFAYQDIKRAFEYYLENYNEGRPIIIGAHSQGAWLGKRLIQEYFDGKKLQDRLVVAYLIGMPIRENDFKSIKACEDEFEIGCFCSWRSYQRNFLPTYHVPNSNIVVTNPLSWKTDTNYVPKEENRGTLLRNFDEGLLPGIADAQVYEDFLWVTKPKFKGSIFITFKNYHIADYNLFYADLRQNAIDRANMYFESH